MSSMAASSRSRSAALSAYRQMGAGSLRCTASLGPMAGQGHVWTAPTGQGIFFGFLLAVGCKSCVRPVCAVPWPLALMWSADRVPIIRSRSIAL